MCKLFVLDKNTWNITMYQKKKKQQKKRKKKQRKKKGNSLKTSTQKCKYKRTVNAIL